MEDLQESWLPSSFSSSPNTQPLSIDVELWLMAEQRTQEILCAVQPALVSDRSRNEIIDYVQRLINDYYGIEVFSFGSVPLKTYLPDGDIDLTVLSHQNAEEDLVTDLCGILEGEEKDSDFEVRDVHFIHAQVKIVKCTIRNIAVDISFNQMAGLSALCFLEQVDHLIGKDHLFKRSIILIKAWCYYESRILGAHHGLISTYALETLVLYIINLFHSSLCGPLTVLYRFLDYYSTFDWDNYCVSINGPVAISSLPEIMAETTDGDDLLLSQEFLRHCRDMYSVPTWTVETGHDFPIKHLNIVDPLKDNNNLGRSVSKGNFHRIRCAFSFGAQRLRGILMLPSESLGVKLEMFFMNTLDRNGKGQRSDVQVPVPAFGTGRSEASDLSGDYDGYYNSLIHGQWYHGYILLIPAQSSPPSSSQIQNKSSWDILRRLVHSKQYDYNPRGTDIFVPILPYCHPYNSHLFAGTYGYDEKGKSRGTGTYIPNMSYYSYGDRRESTRSLEYRPRGLVLKSPKKTDKVEYPPETDNGGNGVCLDLSQEQFPHLSEIKKPTPSDINQPGQPTVKTPQAKNCSSSLGSIRFGSYECSTSSTRQAGSAFSTTLGSGSREETVLAQTYQLKDDKDFPTLSM